MKKIVLTAALFVSAITSKSQVMQAKAIWSNISVPQMVCWQCKEKLNNYLLRETGPNSEGGIIKWTVNMNTATVRIQYYPDKITLGYLETAIANAGFDADTIKAEPDSYNRLPPICKRKEDGGGPQKGKPCNMEPQ